MSPSAELTALMAAGIPPSRVVWPLLILAIGVGAMRMSHFYPNPRGGGQRSLATGSQPSPGRAAAAAEPQRPSGLAPVRAVTRAPGGRHVP